MTFCLTQRKQFDEYGIVKEKRFIESDDDAHLGTSSWQVSLHTSSVRVTECME